MTSITVISVWCSNTMKSWTFRLSCWKSFFQPWKLPSIYNFSYLSARNKPTIILAHSTYTHHNYRNRNSIVDWSGNWKAIIGNCFRFRSNQSSFMCLLCSNSSGIFQHFPFSHNLPFTLCACIRRTLWCIWCAFLSLSLSPALSHPAKHEIASNWWLVW